ncbi:hypothetical protein J5277_22305 [Rhizobium sp. 16-449-1b]|uniref:hypothetical protein n=1 Tax=Rhizobium sp. 16-449-1b TaxID=2819989 RepID=UPI000ADC345B|nr:hypothetical protein [Rhizobium sp. 16-449-1b]MBO9196847.1 hypothetical protein [Rhizobium sp. 16-449-1b]
MSVEPIGVITVFIGLICLFYGYKATAIIFVVMTVFGSAAAFIAGAASIQPAHLFLMFLVLSVLPWRFNVGVALRGLRFAQPGFWLACLVLYGAISGFFMPRLLAGATQIIPVGSSEYPETGGTVPLGPLSSNFTQTVYLTADLVCFLTVLAVASTKRGFYAIVTGLIAYASMNAVFAMLDLVTGATGTADLLAFMRNAQYAFHDKESIAGLKRIVGSFPEASAFAGMTLGALGFTATMWICGRQARWMGFLALLSLALILLSTSSTGLVATPVCMVILYVTAIARCGVGRDRRNSTLVVLLAPQLFILAGIIVVLNSGLFDTLYHYVDLLILSKSTTSSGVERASWNAYGIQNFLDSWGMGVGLGTSRTSSFPIALLSNVGLPGTLFFVLFAFCAIGRKRGVERTVDADVRLAARNGCLFLLIGATVAGAMVDLGLLFFILAALASSEPENEYALPLGGWKKSTTAGGKQDLAAMHARAN